MQVRRSAHPLNTNFAMKKILLPLLAGILSGCAERPAGETLIDAYPPIFPDYIGVTVPVGIAPLNFAIDSAESIYAVVQPANGDRLVAAGQCANFDIDDWHSMLSQNAGHDLSVSVWAKRNGQWLKYNSFGISVSTDSLTDYGVAYRKIAPGYETFSNIGIYQRDLSNFNEMPIVESTSVPGQCINCHAFRGTKPDHFQLHFRGEHGATLVQTHGERRWLSTKTDSTIANCMYPYWHPTGRYCAYSLNLVHQWFFTAGEQYIEVFDKASDAVVLDVERNELILSPLLTTDDLETYPVFAADGSAIYYCTAKRFDNPSDCELIRYNLCRVTFDAATGQIGNKVDTLLHVSEQGHSITFPSPSHDGRFLMYCRADFGVFPINHKEADLWLLDLHTGRTFALEGANSPDTESYHSWSSNSRWCVFSSRRGDGLYSRLYICHIDEHGRASKPFMMPQRNPLEYYSQSPYAYNVPEFVAERVEYDARAASRELFSDEREQTSVRR